MKNIKSFNYILYFNFWYIIIILTFKIFLKKILNDLSQISLKIPIDISAKLKDLTNIKNNMIFETGEFNFISLIQLILYFFIGIKYPNNTLLILLCSLLNEFILLFFINESNIFSSLLINLFGYFLGNLLSSNKNKIKSNTQEYSPYIRY